MSQTANYGIDAPDVLRRMFVIGVVGVAVGLALFWLPFVPRNGLTVSLANTGVWAGSMCLLTGGVMLWGSKFGKLRLRDKIVNSFEWRGDEQVLDVGCGHGLMLIAAAKRLKTGKATGVDLWQKEDQAGNSAEATAENVRLEGVTDRVELKDGDARALPFESDTFDAVLSSWALHNIYEKQERDKAIREIVRVLKPGGRTVIVDIRHAGEYAEVMRGEGMRDVDISAPNFLFVIPTFRVTATKPKAETRQVQ